MKKIVLVLGLFLCFQAQASDGKFEIAFKNSHSAKIKSGEVIEVNWWIEKAPAAGQVQLFLSGTSDRGVKIASSGFYKGKSILPDQIGKTSSGTEFFATQDLPTGTYELVAYICDYKISACGADRYSLNRHKSNKLTIKIENKNSYYLNFNDNTLRAKSFDFSDSVNFDWLTENYPTGFLTFKLESGNGTIYDIVLDETKKNEARNDIGNAKEIRQKNFKDRSFEWKGVTAGLDHKYKLNEESPYFGKSIDLKEGLYRLLMYVHRDSGSNKVESYIIKSVPFHLKNKNRVTAKPSVPKKTETKTQEKVEKKVWRPQAKVENSGVKKFKEINGWETDPKAQEKLDIDLVEKQREQLATSKKSRNLSRQKLLWLYKNQSNQSSTVTTKNPNLVLFKKIRTEKQTEVKKSSALKKSNTFKRRTRSIRSNRSKLRSSQFSR